MPRESLIGSYLVRFLSVAGRTRVLLSDLRGGDVIEFETWTAAWAYVDAALQDFDRRSSAATPPSGGPRRG